MRCHKDMNSVSVLLQSSDKDPMQLHFWLLVNPDLPMPCTVKFTLW